MANPESTSEPDLWQPYDPYPEPCHPQRKARCTNSQPIRVRHPCYSDAVNNTVFGRVGMVDFSPVRNIVPGDVSPFPPKSVQPGSVGDDNYTPLVQLMNAGAEVYNAPISDVAANYLNQFCDGVPDSMLAEFHSKVHDQALSICPRDSVVTLNTIRGFSFSKSVLYLVVDGSDPLPATLDGGTYAKRLTAIRTGEDDALFSGKSVSLSASMATPTPTSQPGLPTTRPIILGDKD